MRKKNFKGRCEKRKLLKCEDVCRTFDAIQFAYADLLNGSEEIKSFRVNVLLDGMDGGYTSDFVCVKADNDLMVRECVERKHLTKPLTVKLLQASKDFWLRHGVSDWGIVIEKEGFSMDRSSLKKNMLLKRKNGEVQIKEQGDSEIKGNSIGDTEQIFRVLAIADEEILVIDCIKKTMPVWMEIEKLNDFIEEKGNQTVRGKQILTFWKITALM